MLGNRESQHSFAQIPDVKVPRSQFDRSFAVKDTFDFDYLIPIFVDEVLPGDTINLTVNTFARLATQKVPVMDNMYLDYFFLYCPSRILFEQFEEMMGAQPEDGEEWEYIVPSMDFPAGGPEVGTIFDKMGLPTDVANAWTLPNCLPLRMYNRCWNEWFRDQNLQGKVAQFTDEGPDSPASYTLLKRGKRHDYFTSALPWPQRGDPVFLPLGTSAPITRVPNATYWTTFNAFAESKPVSLDIVTDGAGHLNVPAGSGISLDPRGMLLADLSEATAATINQLREAFAVQSIYELDARAGTRFNEIIRAHYGVVIPDFRLQRPEYLGGGTTTINSHPVANTNPTSGGDAQGKLAAFATSSTQGRYIGFSKSFVEHGYVLGLVCARADLTYQQGLNRMWSKSTRWDFYWPKLSAIGEQAILNKELYLDGSAADEDVFGYQERYAEYRYKPSEIHGEFRSTYATPLDQWHLAEEFASLPALNAAFIVQNTPIERAIAITSEPHLLFDAWFSYKHARAMPVYSVPSTLGRF